MGGGNDDDGEVFSLPLTFSNASNNVVCLVGFASTALGFLEDIDASRKSRVQDANLFGAAERFDRAVRIQADALIHSNTRSYGYRYLHEPIS